MSRFGQAQRVPAQGLTKSESGWALTWTVSLGRSHLAHLGCWLNAVPGAHGSEVSDSLLAVRWDPSLLLEALPPLQSAQSLRFPVLLLGR